MSLEHFFRKYPEVAIAFSGGVDSAYLLYAAKRYAQKVCAYYVKSDFQPQFELDDALKLADLLNVEIKILGLDVLTVAHVKENPADRCYYCKKAIFSTIQNQARADGFFILLDGTNASDIIEDRPGIKAIQELSVHSPLRECGLTKSEIRRLSKEAKLFTWNKPAYACLATRIPTHEEITSDKLFITQQAESYLSSLGFTDFRVRMHNGNARLQLQESQLPLLLDRRKEILKKLKQFYKTVSLDLEVRE